MERAKKGRRATKMRDGTLKLAKEILSRRSASLLLLTLRVLLDQVLEKGILGGKSSGSGLLFDFEMLLSDGL